MKCGVITPVGPGHADSYRFCASSIEIAAQNSTGPFEVIELIPVFDLEGKLGRSKARNIGIDLALESQCDWIFFIDADDVMFDEAFKAITDLAFKYDAIWGKICEAPHGQLANVKIRPGQLESTDNIDDILNVDPFLSLQMGMFIKTSIAAEIKFDEKMDTGEDFKFYLACWLKYKCIKANSVLFINLRGNHSTGPRSANGAMWRTAVTREISLCRLELASKEQSTK
jgi:glycosyltransferase involved in cell wall biosynthesis